MHVLYVTRHTYVHNYYVHIAYTYIIHALGLYIGTYVATLWLMVKLRIRRTFLLIAINVD